MPNNKYKNLVLQFAQFEMEAILLFMLVTTVQGFGPYTTQTYPTWSTQSLRDCSETPTTTTIAFCSTRDPQLYIDPADPHWFIDCGAGGICQKCDHERVLVLSEICQACVGPTDQFNPGVCPTTHPPTVCDNAGCDACPEPFSIVRHDLQRNFCQCAWRTAYCHHCPCNMAFNAARKCCVPNKIIGSANCH